MLCVQMTIKQHMSVFELQTFCLLSGVHQIQLVQTTVAVLVQLCYTRPAEKAMAMYSRSRIKNTQEYELIKRAVKKSLKLYLREKKAGKTEKRWEYVGEIARNIGIKLKHK